MEVSIRRATTADLDAMLSLYKELHEFSPYKDIPFDAKMSKQWIEMHLTVEQGVAYVGEVDGEVVGLIMGLLHDYPPNPQYRMAVETGWFVRTKQGLPTKIGGLLVRKFEQVAKQKGAVFVSLGRLAEKAAPVKEKTSGYQIAETHYLKKVG